MLLGYKRNKLCENMIIFFELLSSQYAIFIHTVGDFFIIQYCWRLGVLQFTRWSHIGRV